MKYIEEPIRKTIIMQESEVLIIKDKNFDIICRSSQ